MNITTLLLATVNRELEWCHIEVLHGRTVVEQGSQGKMHQVKLRDSGGGYEYHKLSWFRLINTDDPRCVQFQLTEYST